MSDEQPDTDDAAARKDESIRNGMIGTFGGHHNIYIQFRDFHVRVVLTARTVGLATLLAILIIVSGPLLSGSVATARLVPNAVPGTTRQTATLSRPKTPGDNARIDPTQIDPCSLALPAEKSLTRWGQVGLDKHSGNFNRCDLLIDPSNGSTTVDVVFELVLPNPGNDGTVSSTECDRNIPHSDQFAVDITVKYQSDGTGSDLCQMADAAKAADVTALDKGPLPPRTPFIAGSLATHHACELLDTPALTTARVVDATPPSQLWNWQCRWGDGDRTVNLRFDQGTPSSANDGKLISLDSRLAYVQADGDGGGGNCLVQIVYRTLPGSDVSELVHLVLNGTDSSEALCAPATQLALDVVSHLR